MKLEDLRAAIDLIRDETDLTLPIQTARVFLEIALQEGISNVEISQAVQLSEGSVSRNIDLLTARGRVGGRPGYSLIASRADPSNRRVLINELSIRGRALIRRIEQLGPRTERARASG